MMQFSHALRCPTFMNNLLVSYAFQCISAHLCAAALAQFASLSLTSKDTLDGVALIAQNSVQRHTRKIFLLNLGYYILVPYTFNWILAIT